MSITRSRRGFFSAICASFIAMFGQRTSAGALAVEATVPADPVERRPFNFNPVTCTYVYDSQNRLVSVIEPGAPNNVTVYTYE
jgi:hypothetical protein